MHTPLVPRTSTSTSTSKAKRGLSKIPRIPKVRRLAAVSVAAVSLLFVTAPGSEAAVRQWNTVPSYGTGSGYAIIDNLSRGSWSSTASGRVQITARSYCVRVQFAPYAYAAVDGTWNNTPWNCTSSATRVFSWSDTFHLAYNGFKFRICTTAGCGSVRYIGF